MSRKNLIPLLTDNPMTVRAIATHLRGRPDRVVDDLEHLSQSLAHTEWEMYVYPAVCKKCDFEFGSDKLRKPSRCPECKSSWLTEPEIEIRARN